MGKTQIIPDFLPKVQRNETLFLRMCASIRKIFSFRRLSLFLKAQTNGNEKQRYIALKSERKRKILFLLDRMGCFQKCKETKAIASHHIFLSRPLSSIP